MLVEGQTRRAHHDHTAHNNLHVFPFWRCHRQPLYSRARSSSKSNLRMLLCKLTYSYVHVVEATFEQESTRVASSILLWLVVAGTAAAGVVCGGWCVGGAQRFG